MSISKFLTAVFLFIGLSLNAQVQIELEQISDSNFEDVDLSNLFGDVKVQIELRNVGTVDADLKWVISAPNPTCRKDFEQFGCDNNQCYTSAVSSNVNPPGEGPDKPSVLAAGESYIYELHVKHNGLAGCCVVNLAFSTVQDPSKILDQIDISYSINDPLCEITSTKDELASKISWGPNPMDDLLTIDSNGDSYSILIHDVNGQLRKKAQIQTASQVDVSDLSSGVYFLTLENSLNQERSLIKLVKQ